MQDNNHLELNVELDILQKQSTRPEILEPTIVAHQPTSQAPARKSLRGWLGQGLIKLGHLLSKERHYI